MTVYRTGVPKARGVHQREARATEFRRRAYELYEAIGPLGPEDLEYIRVHGPTRGKGGRGVRAILINWYGTVAIEAAVAEYRRMTGKQTP